MMYDDNGNPIVGYDDNGNPIPAPKAPAAPQARPAAKAPAKAKQGVIDQLGSMIKTGIMSAGPGVPLLRKIGSAAFDPIFEAPREMTEQEAKAYSGGGSARERARLVSAARDAQGISATTGETLFPAAEASRRANIAQGVRTKGGYIDDNPRAFLGDIISAPVRLGAAMGAHIPGLILNSVKKFPTEVQDNENPFMSYSRGFQSWAADPTGMTGSPSSALFLVPGLNAEALVSGAGAKAAAMGAETALGKVLARKGLEFVASHPKTASTVVRMGEGANMGASGYMMDRHGGGGNGGSAALPAAFGAGAGLGGKLLADMSASALPGYKQIIAEEMKRANPRQAVAKGQEVEGIMREKLRDIGFMQAMRGVNAIDDLSRAHLDKSGEYYDFVENALSPRVKALLDDRPSTKTYDDLIEAGMTPLQAKRWNRKVPLTDEVRGEHLVWTSPEKSMMDIADPDAIGPTLPVLWNDFFKQGEQRVNDAAFYGAPGAAAASGEELNKMLKKKVATIQSLENMKDPSSRMFLQDLSRIRRQANVKHGTSIKYGAAGLQNLLGSEGLGEFPTRFMYGDNRKLQDLGLVPMARSAGKLYKEGKILQQLATGDVKQSLRAGGAIADIAKQSEGLKYRVPLLLHALGVSMEKNAPKFGPNQGEKR